MCDRPARTALDLSAETVTSFAADRGLQVVGVYRDDGVPDTAAEWPAFAAMLAALEAGKAAGLVVTAEHLSPDPDIRADLIVRIQQTGAAVYLVEA
jgi:hypothetical protein